MLVWAFASPSSAAPWSRDALLSESGHADPLREFKDWPYIYLTKQVHLELHRDKTRETVREIILVTSNEGRRQASRKIVLHKDVDLEVRCGTVGLNGQWIPLQGGKPLRKKVGPFVEYTFLLEQVVRGSILVFDYDRKMDWGRSYAEYRVGDDVPVLHARVTIEEDDLVAAATLIRHEYEGLDVTRRTEGEPGRGGRGRVIYDFRDVEPAWQEALAPPPFLYQPTVVMYWEGRRNWNYMVMWDGTYYFNSCNLEKEGDARKVVARVAPSHLDTYARVSGILGFVRDEFQIIGDPDRFQLYPRPARQTFEDRIGTATDVSAVAIGLLRLADIRFRLGLVRPVTYGEWHALAYNANQFERFLPVMEEDDEPLWIDPLCHECAPGDVGRLFVGTKALVFKADIQDDVKSFVETARDRQDLRYQLHNAGWTDIVEVGQRPKWRAAPESFESVRARVTADGDVVGRVVLDLVGQPKLELRQTLRAMDTAGRNEWVIDFLKKRHPYVEQVGEPRIRHLDPGPGRLATQDTLRIAVDFVIPGFLVEGESTTLPATLFAPPVDRPFPDSPHREAPIWMPYSYCSRHETSLELPPTVAVEGALQSLSVRGETVRYSIDYQRDDTTLHGVRMVTTPCVTLPAADAQSLRDEYNKIGAHEAQLVTFSTTTPSKATSSGR